MARSTFATRSTHLILRDIFILMVTRNGRLKDNNKGSYQKEFVREWLMANNFMGREGQQVPDMPDSFVSEITERYIELYERITGETFVRSDTTNIEKRIENNILAFLSKIAFGKAGMSTQIE